MCALHMRCASAKIASGKVEFSITFIETKRPHGICSLCGTRGSYLGMRKARKSASLIFYFASLSDKIVCGVRHLFFPHH